MLDMCYLTQLRETTLFWLELHKTVKTSLENDLVVQNINVFTILHKASHSKVVQCQSVIMVMAQLYRTGHMYITVGLVCKK